MDKEVVGVDEKVAKWAVFPAAWYNRHCATRPLDLDVSRGLHYEAFGLIIFGP